jgi:MFS family permease
LLTPLFVGFFFVQFLSFFGFQMLNTNMSLYVAKIGGGNRAVGFVACAMTLAMVLSRPLAGMLLDSYSRRRILIPAQACIICIMVAYRYIHSIPALIVLRAVHGFFWAFSATAVTAIVAEFLPRSRMGEGMGIFTIAIGLSMSAAPAIGFSTVSSSGFPALFKLCAVAVACAMGLSIFLRPSGPVEQKPEKESSKAVMFLPSALPSGMLIATVAFVSSAIMSFIPFYSVDRGARSAVPFFTLSAMASLIVRPISGKLVDSYPPRAVIFPSMLVLTLSCAALAAAPFRGWMLTAAAAYGLSFGALLGGLQAISLTGADRSHYGSAVATFFLCFDIGNGIGPLFAGLSADFCGYRGTYAALTVLACSLAVIYGVCSTICERKKLAKIATSGR